ncbi:uncharacterized protein LOC122872375 isoform X2 [Siniperca chuatsi]|uniref:uncharacterized protein LOC122872375 isoform X2 n=1 Tax=Siniperca chuatsi TaxID=119488 RepID=UPI001CE0EB67|nr:uncharacterized protein LOC122872375 isoform X2 [Siniperca chuatsi]
MDQWKLWLVLLLLCLCFDCTEEILVKTIGSEPDVTPICTDATLSIITLIVCKISTERSRGAECRLLYQHGQDFVHECDSRFTLMTKNQTVFLHLTSLKPEDRGNYTCECSHARGTDTLYLSITVKGEASTFSTMTILISTSVIGSGTAFIIVTGFVIGLILRNSCCRDSTRSGPSGLSECQTSCSLDKDDPDNLYTSLQQPSSDVYLTISSVHHQHHNKTNSAGDSTATVHLDLDKDGRETDHNCKIYENS